MYFEITEKSVNELRLFANETNEVRKGMFDIADSMRKQAEKHSDEWGQYSDRIIEICNEIIKLTDESNSHMVRISEYCNNIAERYVRIFATDRELEEAQKRLRSEIIERDTDA